MKIGQKQPIGNEFKDRIIMRALAMCKSYLRWKSSGTSSMNAFAQQKKNLSDTMDTYITILIREAKKQGFNEGIDSAIWVAKKYPHSSNLSFNGRLVAKSQVMYEEILRLKK